jgi:DNA segregation ATPase FtsK/SpoIIIE, S-DNA-T family
MSGLRREIVGSVALLSAAFVAGAVVVSAGRDACTARGPFGVVGTWVACASVWSIGRPAALLGAFAVMLVALSLFGRLRANAPRSMALLAGGTVVILPVVLGLMRESQAGLDPATGQWGAFAAYYLEQSLGVAGAWLIVLLSVSVLTVATLAWNPLRLIVGRPPMATPRPPAEAVLAPVRGRPKALELEPAPEEMPAIASTRGVVTDVEVPSTPRERRKPARLPTTEQDDVLVRALVPATTAEPAADDDLLPPTNLLDTPPRASADDGEGELRQIGDRLMAALRTHKVEGTLVGRTTGPTVTQYEIEPAAGVKVRQFASLANDLALAMRAASIRVVAPIPGRGAVGVEVPNPSPQMVGLRELMEAPEFQQARAALPIALGRDLEGNVVVADLARMPHLLIAGATGSGKSVCVNTIITSLLYRHTPKTLRFLMIDPKMVELSVYNGLPHLRHRVITDNKQAAMVLKWAVWEMERRYRLLEANGCRNLQDFNRRVQLFEAGEGPAPKTPPNPEVAFEDQTYRDGILPYVVLVIDEMADLMMTVQGEVEVPIAKLAQKARAIGIHLILATQRPSVNVITGLIKANFPSRIAFRVASQIDSRTIIDGAGAEMLLGSGDMLFVPPGTSEPARVQGAYLSSEETERMMQWFGARVEARAAARVARGLPASEATGPDLLEEVARWEAEQGGGRDDDGSDAVGPGGRDEYFRRAAEVVIESRQGSTSLLQRKLQIGYGRAARIIDELEAAGVLGPSRGARGRDVLIGFDELDRIAPE